MFTMTPAAAAQIRQAAAASQADGMALRVAAKQEADGSLSYGMGFDEARQGEVPALQADGVTILIAPTSRPLLLDTQLDFVELNPGEFSFIFVPQAAAPSGGCASGACAGGCASSRAG